MCQSSSFLVVVGGVADMAAPFSICTKEERRAVICVLCAESEKPAEVIRHMEAQYGDCCLSRTLWEKVVQSRCYGNKTKIAPKGFLKEKLLKIRVDLPIAPVTAYSVRNTKSWTGTIRCYGGLCTVKRYRIAKDLLMGQSGISLDLCPVGPRRGPLLVFDTYSQ
ncbi:hypothetical protein TNCV_3534501 [Trichonephila clavipes]|nr:hypothetical protein TNCV_3534501 [Trichonephila clavipes]